MGRIYTITPTSHLSVSGTRELLSLKVPANKIVVVLEAFWTAPVSENSQQLETKLRFLNADPGGATTGISVAKHDPGDAAHGLTNIWKDSTLGTVATDKEFEGRGDDLRVGWLYRPIPELWVYLVSGDVLSLSLMEAPASTPLLMLPAFKIMVQG